MLAFPVATALIACGQRGGRPGGSKASLASKGEIRHTDVCIHV